jgi:hypothetical protein
MSPGGLLYSALVDEPSYVAPALTTLKKFSRFFRVAELAGIAGQLRVTSRINT